MTGEEVDGQYSDTVRSMAMGRHEEDKREERWYERLGRGAPLTVLVAATLFVAYQLLFVLELIAIAALLALVFREIVRGLGRYELRPWMSTVLMVGVLLGIGAVLGLFLAPNLILEVQSLVSGRDNGVLNEAADRPARSREYSA